MAINCEKLIPSGKGSNSPPAIAHLPPSEGSNAPPAIAHLPPGEGSNSSLACSQSSALLPSREGSSSSQAIAHLPLGEGSSISQATAHLPPGEGNSSPRQVNQAIKLGKALGSLPGIGHPRLPRKIALSPRKTTSPLPPPVGSPKGLLMKNLTLSGSLTFPTNL